MSITREQLIAEALTWIGTPWHHGQQTKGAGCDCLGLLAGIAYAVGYTDARAHVRNSKFRVYARSPDPAMLDEVMAQYGDPIAIQDAGLADVLRLTPMNRGRHAQHFAMVSKVDAAGVPSHMIHCTNQGHVKGVTEHIIGEWRDHIRRAYAWRGVA